MTDHNLRVGRAMGLPDNWYYYGEDSNPWGTPLAEAVCAIYDGVKIKTPEPVMDPESFGDSGEDLGRLIGTGIAIKDKVLTLASIAKQAVNFEWPYLNIIKRKDEMKIETKDSEIAVLFSGLDFPDIPIGGTAEYFYQFNDEVCKHVRNLRYTKRNAERLPIGRAGAPVFSIEHTLTSLMDETGHGIPLKLKI